MKYKELSSLAYMNSFAIMESNGYILQMTSSQANMFTYKLYLKLELKKVSEDDFQESKNFFFSEVHKSPIVLSFVSKSTGGNILFKGVGRYSGSGLGLSDDLSMELLDVIINNRSGFVMDVKDIDNIIKENFPEIPFNVKKEGILINWSDIEKDIILKYSKNAPAYKKEWSKIK